MLHIHSQECQSKEHIGKLCQIGENTECQITYYQEVANKVKSGIRDINNKKCQNRENTKW